MKEGALCAATAAGAADEWPFPGQAASVHLGLRAVETTAQLRKALGVDADRGALVLEVEANGPAERAHLQAGDVITRVAGRPVSNAGDMLDAVAEKREGHRGRAVTNVTRARGRSTWHPHR